MTDRVNNYPGIRRAVKNTELDRLTWADVTEKSYLMRVVESGQYVTNTIYFDRGFEIVPEITWTTTVIEDWADAPNVEVSALNWQQDDNGVYIGVQLQIRACE